MAWWKRIRARWTEPPPRYQSGAWKKRGGYSGWTTPVSELEPPYEWVREKKTQS